MSQLGPDVVEATAGGRRYELLEPIGRGGFGVVYRARVIGSSGFEKEVAVKVLHADIPQRELFAGRMRDEARTLAALRHRAIVAVEDLLQLGEQWAVVMELVEGADLAALMRAGPLPPRAAAEIAREAAFALQAAHAAKDPATGNPMHLVHRDIKPANLRVTPSGDVKVMDFGVAHARFETRESHTESLSFGSWGYMAPERFNEQEPAACDIYALGAVLYECLLGDRLKQLPVDPNRHDKRLKEAINLLPGEDGPLRQLVARMMAFWPDDRPDAGEVASALRGLVPTLPGAWLPDWAGMAIARLRSEDPGQVLYANTFGGGRRETSSPAPPSPESSLLPASAHDAPDPAALRPPKAVPIASVTQFRRHHAGEDRKAERPAPSTDTRANDGQTFPFTPDWDEEPTSLESAAGIGIDSETDQYAAVPEAPAEPESTDETPEAEDPAAPVEAAQTPRRGAPRWLAALAGTGLAVSLLVGLAWLLQTRPTAPTETTPLPVVDAPAVAPPDAPAPPPADAAPAEIPPSEASSPSASASVPSGRPSPMAAPPTPPSTQPEVPEPDPVQNPEPTPEGIVADAVPAPEAAPIPDPAPEALPPPAPAAPDASALAGAWTGQGLGRPLRFQLNISSSGAVTGTAALRLGAEELSHAVRGRVSLREDGSGTIELTETDGARPATYTGQITDREASGQVFVGGKARGSWTARR